MKEKFCSYCGAKLSEHSESKKTSKTVHPKHKCQNIIWVSKYANDYRENEDSWFSDPLSDTGYH